MGEFLTKLEMLRKENKELKEVVKIYDKALKQIAHGETDPEWQSSIIVSGLLRGIADRALKEPEKASRNSYPMGAKLPHLKGETHD